VHNQYSYIVLHTALIKYGSSGNRVGVFGPF
jgi:hypothetical protein